MLRGAIFFVLLAVSNAVAQQGKYASPLNLPLRLAGNFCEIRPDHFHSGIDIKTMGHEGLPVFAVDDGYVSRVKISANGFGKAIYITHNNNRVTLYAHLHSFIGVLGDSIAALQYSRKSFEVEWFPDSTFFPVKKEQQIAWSGNSGGSESPHLHFEIRDEKTEEPLNPLLNGWSIEDTIRPTISKIDVYQYRNGRFIFDKDYPVHHAIVGNDSHDTLYINADTVAIAFAVSDYMNDSVPSDLGIYSACLMSNNDTLYHYSFDRMNFNETRNVNGYIDYRQKELQKKVYQRCFTVPGNKFSALRNAGLGLAAIRHGATIQMKIMVTDANNNIAEELFYIKNDTSIIKPVQSGLNSIIYYPNKKISQKWIDAATVIPEDAVFETVDGIRFSRKYNRKTKLPVISIEPKGTALKKMYSMSIKPAAKYKALKDKMVVVEIDDQEKIIRSLGGVYKINAVTTSIWTFGNYTLSVDTVPPVFQDCVVETDSVFHQALLRIKMNDNLSGIKSYEGRINGNWALFEYDPKSATISYQLKKNNTKLDIYIKATDQSGNTGSFTKSMEIVFPAPFIK